MSYAGEMNFGLLGDFDALPDIESIGDSIAEELAELVELAREKQALEAQKNNGAPTKLPSGAKPATSGSKRANSPKRTSRPRSSSRATKGA
jgi:hypothetical protein